MLSFKPAFSLSTFTFIKRLFSSSSLSTISQVQVAAGRTWVEGDDGGDLMGPMLKREKKEMPGPKKSLTAGGRVSALSSHHF